MRFIIFDGIQPYGKVSVNVDHITHYWPENHREGEAPIFREIVCIQLVNQTILKVDTTVEQLSAHLQKVAY